MTESAVEQRCPGCGARVGERDRACFACHRPLQARRASRPKPDAAADRDVTRTVTPQRVTPHREVRESKRSAESSTKVDESLEAVIVFGKSRQAAVVPADGATVGSTREADIVVAAPFLASTHAKFERRPDGWHLAATAPGAAILHRGASTNDAVVVPGEIYRIADAIGNFVTVKLTSRKPRGLREGKLRAQLPQPGQSYLIGSDPSCIAQLDHPLVQKRHAAIRCDESGVIWLEDRATAAGTYVNGHRLRGRTRLTRGDVIQIGPYSATVGETSLEPLPQLPGVDIAADHAAITVSSQAGKRYLLRDVSLHLEPASLTAVVGPSGAGKTTLMRMLSGQLAATEGIVAYNGTDLSQCRETFAALMGFVPQDDVVHQDLTIVEALDYQARLRLGSTVSQAERWTRIEQLIAMLGLTEQRDQLVRTLSGGQRKRVSIACELLKEPQLLFLDEPTSGLDPGLDKRMMLLLRLLADQGRTVLLTTHAISHVDTCDTLILVGPGGHVMYVGPPDEAHEWFGVGGLGDVFSLTETVEAASEAAQRRAAAPTDASHDIASEVAEPATRTSGVARPETWSTAWRAATVAHARVFLARQAKLLVRDRAALAFTLLQGIVVGLLTALVAPRPLTWDVNGNSVMFVFGCAAVWFGMISAVREIVKERPIWRREFMAGASLPAYLASKVVILAALGLVQSVTLTIVLALTLHLPATDSVGGPALGIVTTLWLASTCGNALGLLVSAAARTADRAMSLVPYLLIAQLVLCGVLFRLGALTFISWLMPARWSVSILGGIAGLSSSALDQSSGLYPHSDGGIIGSWLMLCLLTSLALAATAWSLVRQGRSWQAGVEPPPLMRTLIRRLSQAYA